ncbi:MAG: hypothetical protein HXS46_17220 [Theionarchaea archaeon]|nr:hypothetical protein [Theionarchaea archaeon]
MKVSEILTKSVDIITEQPQMLIPYVIPLLVSLIAIWARMTNMMAWGIGRLYPLGRAPEKFLTYFVTAFRAVNGTTLVVWVIVLILLAICVALTIVMSDAALSGRQMKVGEAFDRIGKKMPLFVVAFLISWFLKFFGMLFFWVGIFVPAVFLIFVGQAMLLDNKDLFDSFSKSYDAAKENWIEILVLLFIFLVILAFVRFIPLLGVIVACFLVCYSAVVFTMMYRDRGRAVSAE